MIQRYLGLYSKDTPKWDDIGHLSATYGWTELTASSTMEYLLHKGIGRRYISELVEGATRVNYGQVNPISTFVSGQYTEFTPRMLITFTRWRAYVLLPRLVLPESKEGTSRSSNNSLNDLARPFTLTPPSAASSPRPTLNTGQSRLLKELKTIPPSSSQHHSIQRTSSFLMPSLSRFLHNPTSISTLRS